jgi:hypothetical protein
MSRYEKLWGEVATRLRSALSILQVDDPVLACRVSQAINEWLEHNELELGLDELLAGADESTAIIRRRFWEELLAVTLGMQIKVYFSGIVERIVDLEPYLFDASEAVPRVYCDFNGQIELNIYSLNSIGTVLDFARLRCFPEPEQRVCLYDYDEDNGVASWLLVNATIVEHVLYGLVAQADPLSYRWEKR